MRSYSSILLASALAMGAVAKPLDKRVMVTEIDLEVVTTTVYVTAGADATPVSAEGVGHGYETPEAPAATSSQAPPKPATSQGAGYGVAPVSSSPAPKPATSQGAGYGVAPASSSSQAPPKPATSEGAGYGVAPVPSSSSAAPKPSSSSSAYVPAPEPSTSAPVQYTSSAPPVQYTSSAPPVQYTSSAAAPSSTAPSTPSYGVEHKSGEQQAEYHQGTDYANAMTWHHNRARANHGAPNLEWSDDCAAAAANAAAYCDFEHHVVDGQGQNLFTVSGDAYNATAGITESWYKNELQPYIEATQQGGGEPAMDNFHVWGHYSQVIWKSTTHVGCATINCGSKMTLDGQSSDLNLYTVCNYSPPGNYEGEYVKNVAAPKGEYQTYSWAD